MLQEQLAVIQVVRALVVLVEIVLAENPRLAGPGRIHRPGRRRRQHCLTR